MVFSSTVFIFIFLPAVLVMDKILPLKIRNIFLIFASFLFFSWSQPQYLWLLLLNILINYLGGILVSAEGEKKKKFFFICTIVLNLVLLIYFKYFDFLIKTVNDIAGRNISMKNIILPIGISFFTFQGMSYVIDVYRNKVKKQKNILNLCLYISLFPQLVAGPIVRYIDVEKEIENRPGKKGEYYQGICRFIMGLGKKAILANSLAVITDQIWGAGAGLNTSSVAWLGSLTYTLQIYFDFSGYSDMAIGIGLLLGFHFMENFNYPYISKSITEFWRRWHISLSSWFRDYVYIPLGGNRKHVYLNLLVVFLLTGLWHGAAWNFVMWGGINGAFIVLERFICSALKKERNTSEIQTESRILNAIKHAYTLFIVNFIWVFFRAPSIEEAWLYIKTMLGLYTSSTPLFGLGWYLNIWNITVIAIAIFCAFPISRKIKDICEKMDGRVLLLIKNTGLILIFAYSVIRVASGTYNPFIYFQF